MPRKFRSGQQFTPKTEAADGLIGGETMSILFAIIFLVVIFKCVGLVLGICGKLLGAVLSLFGFILSIAIGAVVFGLSTAFALILLCIAAGWLLIKLIF